MARLCQNIRSYIDVGLEAAGGLCIPGWSELGFLMIRSQARAVQNANLCRDSRSIRRAQKVASPRLGWLFVWWIYDGRPPELCDPHNLTRVEDIWSHPGCRGHPLLYIYFAFIQWLHMAFGCRMPIPVWHSAFACACKCAFRAATARHKTQDTSIDRT